MDGGWGVGGSGDTSIAGDGGQCACGVGGGRGSGETSIAGDGGQSRVVVGGRVESGWGGRGVVVAKPV